MAALIPKAYFPATRNRCKPPLRRFGKGISFFSFLFFSFLFFFGIKLSTELSRHATQQNPSHQAPRLRPLKRPRNFAEELNEELLKKLNDAQDANKVLEELHLFQRRHQGKYCLPVLQTIPIRQVTNFCVGSSDRSCHPHGTNRGHWSNRRLIVM